jgi:hypothetical protein
VRFGVAATTSVTGTLSGLFDAPLDANVTVPWYVPGARPVGFTETVSVPGLVLLAGVAESQVPPEVVEDVTV